MELAEETKSLVCQKAMSQSDTNIVPSSKDFSHLVSRFMPSNTVLHIDQDNIDQTIASLDPWKYVLVADGIHKINDVICFFKDQEIQLRHIFGQYVPDHVIKYCSVCSSMIY